jgi:hypothetical protein
MHTCALETFTPPQASRAPSGLLPAVAVFVAVGAVPLIGLARILTAIAVFILVARTALARRSLHHAL